MSLLFREAPNATRRDFGSQANVIPAPSQVDDATGLYVYRSWDAMRIAAVVACVGLRAGAFAQLPIRAYAGDTAGSPEMVPPPPLIASPGGDLVVPSVWKTQMSISRDIWGWAAGPITAVDGAGYPAAARLLLPDEQIHPIEYADGSIEWRVFGQPVDASTILHIPSRWVMPGHPLGISPLEKSGLVDLAKRAQDFGRNWFLNGAVPSSIIYSDKELTTEQADGLLSSIRRRWKSRNPAVLGSGLKYEKVAVAANESQFLETMRQAAADIAISFNLPVDRINAATDSGSTMKYQNVEQGTQQYLMDSINPDLVVIQEVLERHQRPGTYLRWKTGAFLRSDLKTRYESYQIGITAGFLDKDEARAWEELPPMPATPIGGAQ